MKATKNTFQLLGITGIICIKKGERLIFKVVVSCMSMSINKI